jgi:hypothetical protein
MLCLVAAWIAVLRWVGASPRGMIEIGPWRWSVAAVLYSYIPLAILFLAVRFSWRFAIGPRVAHTEGAKRSSPETVFAVLGLILMIGLICAILLQPAIQRVRDAGGANLVAKTECILPAGACYNDGPPCIVCIPAIESPSIKDA